MRLFLCIAIFLVVFQPASGQSPAGIREYRIKHISLDQGLSQSQVYCILQDRVGFMWFGTQDGLNRYDGYSFVQYKYDPAAEDSLSNNLVNALLLTREGDLWVGTYDGLDRYHPESDSFTRYYASDDDLGLPNSRIRALLQTRSGLIWVGTAKGLCRLEPTSGTMTRLSPANDTENILANAFITSIEEDNEGRLWVASSSGLFMKDRNVPHFERIALLPDEPVITSTKVKTTRDGQVWIATAANGLFRYRPEHDDFENWVEEEGGLNSSSISDIFEDSRGGLWLATQGGGLDLMNREDGSFSYFMHNPRDLNTLSSNVVFCVYEDRSGVVWAGLNVRGLSTLDPFAAKFTYYAPNPQLENRLTYSNISAIRQDKNGYLWLGTFRDGLNRLDRKTGIYRHFKTNGKKNGLNSNVVASLYEDRKGNLWIGGGKGLSRYDEGSFTHYIHDPSDPHSISTGWVFAMLEDRQGRFWVGVMGTGLNQFDPKNASFTLYPNREDSPNRLGFNGIRALYQDRAGNLWVGTMGGGLNLFNPDDGSFQPYLYKADDPFSISHNIVLSILEHPLQDGKLWVGTMGGGLNLMDVASGRFMRYTEQNSDLPSNVVYGILNDDEGHLWLSTNLGISRFHMASGSFTNYDTDDGLQSKEFNQGAYFKTQKGELMFGGINGFNTFYPDDIKDNPIAPQVAITDIRIMGKSIMYGASRRGSPLRDGVLRLSYKQNDLSFDFVGLHFSRPEENLYQHKLENYDRAWHPPDSTRSATYTNLDPGTYEFKVKTANNDGIWNQQGLKIRVEIAPPWYKTARAYTLYLLALLAILLLGNRAQRLRLIRMERQRSQIKETRLRVEAAELKARAVEAQSQALRAENERKELERAALEAENTRKNMELAKARQLQLSMLPEDVPRLPHLEISVYMETATEVGGDYYDFKTNDQGVLTAVIGDATGHGLQAGTVVAATKSLFNALARDTEPVPLLRKMSQSLKEMGFHNMFMGLTIARFDNAHLQMASAGMPFPLLYRKKEGTLHTVETRGMPLGTLPDFPYRTVDLWLEDGDTLLLMSDGLQECFDHDNKMLGVPRTRDLFEKAAQSAPPDIIEEMVKQGKKWANGRPLDDDMTLVVFRFHQESNRDKQS